MRFRIFSGLVSIVGAILAVLAALVGWAILPGVIDRKIEQACRLTPGTKMWDTWSGVSTTVKLKLHIFNVTNPEEVESDGGSPILQDFGPYVYDEIRVKDDLMTINGSVFFRQRTFYKFNEAESFGSESDTYNVVNIAYVSLLKGISDRAPVFLSMLADYCERAGETIIKRRVSVRDLTFDGYDVSVFLNHPILGPRLPKQFEGGRFGLYKNKNGTDDGYFQIDTGVEGMPSRLGEIIEWENRTTLGYWTTPDGPSQCDTISGSDGSLYPPFVEKNRMLKVFSPSLCRSMFLTFNEEIEIYGLSGYKFTVPEEMLSDPRENNDNRCFCKKENVSECDFGGVIDVSPCRNGAPIVMSMPHFLGGDSRYQKQTGLNPQKDLHQTEIILEPHTGIVLSARKRIQVNLRLKRYEQTQFANVSEVIFPVVWAEEGAQISPEGAKKLDDALVGIIKIIDNARRTVLGIGLFLAAVGALLFFMKK